VPAHDDVQLGWPDVLSITTVASTTPNSSPDYPLIVFPPLYIFEIEADGSFETGFDSELKSGPAAQKPPRGYHDRSKEKKDEARAALAFVRQRFPDKHTIFVRPGGSDGRKSWTAMDTGLGLSSITGSSIEGIRHDEDHPNVYHQTQSLFLGHFQEFGPPVQTAPAAAGTPPPASALWSIVYTQEASFHYKGTPSEQGSDPKGLKGTLTGIGDPKAASARTRTRTQHTCSCACTQPHTLSLSLCLTHTQARMHAHSNKRTTEAKPRESCHMAFSLLIKLLIALC